MAEKKFEKLKNNNAIARIEKKFPYRNIFAEHNKVYISGKIGERFNLSHETKGEKFYRSKVIVKRKSGIVDYIPIIISEKLLPIDIENVINKYIEVAGQFRAYLVKDSINERHLNLYVYATLIHICEKEEELNEREGTNVIYIDGNLSRIPQYRVTPTGREISDIMVSVQRNYEKIDYIPVITWNCIAKWIKNKEPKEEITLFGRIQSRNYPKRCNGKEVNKEVYEVSLMAVKQYES